MRTFQTAEHNVIWTLKIESDTFYENPLKSNTMFGEIIGKDKTIGFSFNERATNLNAYNDWESWAKHELYRNVVFKLPIFMYEHSGIKLAFSNLWNTQQIGFYTFTREQVFELTAKKRLTVDVKRQLEEIALAHLHHYVEWLNGAIYSVTIMKDKELVTSHTGFYAGLNESFDDVEKEIFEFVLNEGYQVFEPLFSNAEKIAEKIS